MSAENCDGRGDCCHSGGRLAVVGFGPGSILDRTRRAEEAINASDVIVGYSPYLDRIADLLEGKEAIGSGMRQERERCRLAIDRAAAGEKVAIVSSGDAGVYGMAGLVLEMVEQDGLNISVEIIPGVTAASSAAAKLGAPLMLDYATISLSDLLTPWEVIRKRLEAVFAADLVVALYNPKSHKRLMPFNEMLSIARKHRQDDTPVGIATALGQDDEHVVMIRLDQLADAEVNMKSIVIIGNSTSRKLGNWLVTPRGYNL
ncbi:MAG: precorrin-3B C(17)-methyltransferase [Planctomycetes bacterium]|nr:precorrin-3B C(17)-methyltransferase [Planctomycetota bacterium]